METTAKKYFIENKDEFLKLRASWKNYVNSGKGPWPNAAQMIIYNVIRSMSPFRGFSKGTNPGRINAKQYGEWDGYLQPLNRIKNILRYAENDKFFSRKAQDLLEPFQIKEEKCIEFLKHVYDVVRNTSLPE